MSSITGLKSGVYTSTTRPTVPFIGETIFESDTGRVMVYYGTTIGWQPMWIYDWGEIAEVESTTTFTMAPTVADVPGMSITWTTILNRVYIPSAWTAARHFSGNASGVSWNFSDELNNVLGTITEGGSGWGFGAANTQSGRFAQLPIILGTGGSKTVKLRAVAGAATGELTASATMKIALHIRDCGPSGLPPIAA